MKIDYFDEKFLFCSLGMMWLKLLLPCTYVKDTKENAPIKTDLIFLLIQHSSKEDGKGNS